MGRSEEGFSIWRLFVVLVLLAIIFGAVYARAYVILPTIITSRSMQPTLLVGDWLMINRAAYKTSLPKPGEIVALNTTDRSEVWIKRVVAGPGDTVEIRGGKLLRNGRLVEEPYILTHPDLAHGPVRVPQGRVFVLGDNRVNSDDSRSWGTLRHDLVVGKVTYIYWPRQRMGRPGGPGKGS